MFMFTWLPSTLRVTYRKSILMYKVVNDLVPNDLTIRRGCDRMVIGFTTTCAINAYHH